MTPAERAKRFEELKEIVAQTGGVLLDSTITLELVTLGSLLGVTVEWKRVELPVFGKPAVEKESKSKQHAGARQRQRASTATRMRQPTMLADV